LNGYQKDGVFEEQNEPGKLVILAKETVSQWRNYNKSRHAGVGWHPELFNINGIRCRASLALNEKVNYDKVSCAGMTE
jgi:hypothetical protein